MQLQKYIDIITTKKKGQFITIETETPITQINAIGKANGYAISKNVTAQYRTGIRYEKIKAVIEARKNGTLPLVATPKPNFSWVITDIIGYNSNTTKHYARLVPHRKNKHKATYIIKQNGNIVATADTLKGYEQFIQPSYFKEKEKAIVKDINVDNIIRVK